MPGRTMSGYSELPRDATLNVAALRTWLKRAATATSALPAKAAKTKKAAKTAANVTPAGKAAGAARRGR